MIDHTGHPHPSTPKARALCRANGGTGFIGKIGGNAPVADKKDNDRRPHVPQGPVNVTPKKPEPPKGPPVRKGPAVPKDHGTPKPVTPRHPTPIPAPKPAPEVKNDNPPRDITPKNFNKTKMEIKDGNGNWQTVARITIEPGQRGSGGHHKRAAEYRFIGADGKLIRAASPNEKITVRDKVIGRAPDLPPAAPKPSPGIPLTDLIPPATSENGLRNARIQNALRRGASREFIAARLGGDRDQVNRDIDAILDQYGVPNHLYPRAGGGGKPPVAKDVKQGSPIPNDRLAGQAVETPTFDGPEPIDLTRVKGRVDVSNPVVERNIHRVLAVQHSHVGDQVKRIKKIQNDLSTKPGVGYRADSENTLAICTHDGQIHFHESLTRKQEIINQCLKSGWFTPGGNGLDQVMAHEMGHAFLTDAKMTPEKRRLMINSMVEIFGLENPNIQNWYGGTINAVMNHGNNKNKLRRAVSKYGTTNINEFIAEVWSEYTMNKKPRPKIKRMGDVLKKIITDQVVR